MLKKDLFNLCPSTANHPQCHSFYKSWSTETEIDNDLDNNDPDRDSVDSDSDSENAHFVYTACCFSCISDGIIICEKDCRGKQ